MLKLLIVTTQDRFFLTHLLDRAKYFKSAGWQVFVAAQETSPEHKKQIEELGFSFYDTKVERRSVNPVDSLASLVRFLKIYSDVSPDFCFHLGAKSIFLGTAAILLLGKATKIVNAPIGLGHIFISNSYKSRLLRQIVKFGYRIFLNPKGSQVIIENKDDIDFFIKLGALRKTSANLIPGAGVDVRKFCPVKHENTTCTVVMVSRVIKEKGVLEYSQASELLHKRGVDVKMLLVGEPDFSNPSSLTENEFKKIRDNGYVECLGYKEDVTEILQGADICCLPSYREGLPRALIEAVSCGLPIVTTDVVGCRDVVCRGNGILVPPKDSTKLADAIEYLISNPKVRYEMGRESRDLALNKFDKDLINRSTFDLFVKML